MPGLMIIAHAPLASSLKAVAEHVYPECRGSVEAVDVGPDDAIDALEASAHALLRRIRDPQALILTDVFGATPCNLAQRLAQDPQIRVIAGVNVPMLWRALCYAREPLDLLVDKAMTGATQGVIRVPAPESRSITPSPDAG
jgi:mannose PTS system EIIA component